MDMAHAYAVETMREFIKAYKAAGFNFLRSDVERMEEALKDLEKQNSLTLTMLSHEEKRGL